jgi:hypothetical protein
MCEMLEKVCDINTMWYNRCKVWTLQWNACLQALNQQS